MSFVSFEFIMLFAVTVPLYFVFPQRWRWALLLTASYLFYAYWNTTLIFLIVFSSLVDYVAGREIWRAAPDDQRRRRAWLLVSLALNLGTLFLFKYFNFFVGSAAAALNSLGIQANPVVLQLVLPVGISFYTFQSLSYTIDIYRRKIEPEPHLGIFLTYVAFFPQLVAGPIERAGFLLPQFKVKHHFDIARTTSGLRLILWGVFKKLMIADRLAIYVDTVFAAPDQYSGPILLTAIAFFGFQIYADFSAYSDIAVGAARVMGFELTVNFRQPMLARSVRDYWQRWHVSLTRWFQEYVYFPLGGSRKGFPRMLFNICVTVMLSALWHGASWTFIIWGSIYLVALLGELLWARARGTSREVSSSVIGSIRGWLWAFSVSTVARTFFRAPTVAVAFSILAGIPSLSAPVTDLGQPFESAVLGGSGELILSAVVIGLLMLYDYIDLRWDAQQVLARQATAVRWGWYYLLGFGVVWALLYGTTAQRFIYFQF